MGSRRDRVMEVSRVPATSLHREHPRVAVDVARSHDSSRTSGSKACTLTIAISECITHSRTDVESEEFTNSHGVSHNLAVADYDTRTDDIAVEHSEP